MGDFGMDKLKLKTMKCYGRLLSIRPTFVTKVKDMLDTGTPLTVYLMILVFPHLQDTKFLLGQKLGHK